MSDPKQNGHEKINFDELPPPYEWTVLLYMAGDNNLSEECVYALMEIKDALADNPRLKVVAQFDPAGRRAETKRYELHPHPHSLEHDARKTRWRTKETDTGEPSNLLDFLRWGMPTFRAEHYMVVLVGHGTGTDDDFLRDENPPNSLSIFELETIVKKMRDDGYTIDILGMDTCLMSMAEVCYQLLEHKVGYMVASEGFAPNTGWPYASIIDELSKNIPVDGTMSQADPRWLAQMIVDKYREFYEPYINGGISVDQSVLEVALIDDVQKAMSDLVGVLLKEFKDGQLNYGSEKQNALILAHWETQSYNGEAFVDLYDFCKLLKARYKEPEVDDKCQKVIDAITKLVVRSVVSGAAFQFSYGLSISFPWATLSPDYINLSFPKQTKWTDFLKLYHFKTQRKGRGEQIAGGVNHQAVLSTPGEVPPVRATVPTNKGRNGEVQSMRNPPSEEFVGTWPIEEPHVPDKRPAVTAVHWNNGEKQKGTSVTTASKKKSGQVDKGVAKAARKT